MTSSNDGLWAVGLSAGDNSFRIVNNGSIYGASNEFFTIKNGGNTGIGLTNPATILDVKGTSKDSYLQIRGRDADDYTSEGFHTRLRFARAGAQFLGHVGYVVRSSSQGGARTELLSGGALALGVNGSVNPTLFITSSGDTGIGTVSPTHKLTVNGTIKAEEVIVEAGIAANDITIRPKAWADDVFAPDYELPTTESIVAHVATHGHLPGVPSAAEVTEKGVSLGDMQATLLRKVEELTLYVIEIKSENAELRSRIEQLECNQ